MARVLITNFHPRGGGGHVSYIKSLVGTDIPGGHQLAVATPAGSRLYEHLHSASFPRLYACNFPAKLQKEPRHIWQSLARFRQIVADFKPDIIHTNGVDQFQALWSFPLRRTYQIIRTHHAVRHFPRDFYHRHIYGSRIARHIFVSEESMRLSVGEGPTLAHATVIENGVDLDHFQPRPKNSALATSLGLDPEALCLGSCAGTGSYKRIDLLIEALRQIGPDTRRKIAVLVLGDRGSGEALAARARAAGLSQFIYAGQQTDVRPYVSLFDVGFILSDSIETISYAAREMMAMGKPLISSSFSGLRANVQDGINGILVEPGHVPPVKKAVEFFRDLSPGILEEFSRAARSRAQERFDVQKQRQLHGELYQDVVDHT